VNVGKVDHVGIAVRSIREASRLFIDVLGGEYVLGGDDERIGIGTIQIRLGAFKIELMEPLDQSSFLQRFLDKHGEGFHHLTMHVDDLEQAIRELEGAGVEVVDTDLRNPAWRETFVRPKSGFGTLLQIVQTDTPGAWDEPVEGVTLGAVLAGRVATTGDGFRLRTLAGEQEECDRPACPRRQVSSQRRFK
jgi:methylmalonyl-CoA/ethylmalonyl-CoA epimerase